MSDLKHQTPAQLVGLISWCARTREAKERIRREKQLEIIRLQTEILELGHQIHNIGQKEAWARLYYAKAT